MSTGIGALLRETREGQDRSLEEVASRLRARRSQLEALEDERFGDFGGDVYAKGFLRSYAVELGLDADPLLDTYRREVSHDEAAPMAMATSVGTPRQQRSAPPSWMGWVLVAVVVLAGVALLGNLFDGGRTPDQASTDEVDTPPPPPAAAGSDDRNDDPDGVADTPDDAEPEPTVEDEPAEEPEPEIEGLELTLALEADSWMRVIVDGSVLLEQVVEAGETLQFPGDREIEVRFGNAGGVRANLNGEDLGAQGASGEAVTILYTEEGVEEA